jgi:histidinol-phosphate aminotransferase
MIGLKINRNIIGKKKYVLPDAEPYKWKLDVNENLYPHCSEVLSPQTNFDANTSDLHTYPLSHCELIKLIAEYCQVLPNEIILTNGSDVGLDIIMRALITEESRVLVPTPTFAQAKLFIEIAGPKEIIQVEAVDENDIINIDYSNCDLVYLITPSSAIGYIISSNTIKTIAEKYPNTWFIIDEAYIEYGGESSAHLFTKRDDTKFYCLRNVVIVRTFSKAFGLAGVRIGYILADETVCNVLSPLVGSKSVTNASALYACKVLKNLPYYLNNIAKLESDKHILRSRLDQIVSKDCPIRKYNIQGGNFFLLHVDDSARICKIFKSHGILIRNRHDDIPNTVRITIGPWYIMEDVLYVCKFINVKKLLLDAASNGRICMDLDLTLRNGSTINSPLMPGWEIIKLLNPIILTNNNCTPSELSKYFMQHCQFCVYKIITASSSGLDYIKDNNLHPHIFSGTELMSYFAAYNLNNYTLENCDCIYLAWTNITFFDVVNICKELSKGKLLLYTDNCTQCELKSSCDFGFEYPDSTVLMPDMESIINMIRTASADYDKLIKCVGKPNMNIKCDIMIGDSTSDENQAYMSGASFIWISGENGKNRYNFKRNCIEVTDIKYLYDSMTL